MALLTLPAAAAVPAVNPDAALLALCDGLDAIELQWTRLDHEVAALDIRTGRGLELHNMLCAMVPSLHAFEDQIADTPAATLDGLRRKAGALRLRLGGLTGATEPMEQDDGLAWSLAQDVLRLIGERA